jgi:hypothetical protein
MHNLTTPASTGMSAFDRLVLYSLGHSSSVQLWRPRFIMIETNWAGVVAVASWAVI